MSRTRKISRVRLLGLSAGALTLVCGAALAAAETLDGPVPARLERVVDGDTIRVRARVWIGQEVSVAVRLRGVDAPELRAACDGERVAAERARAHVVRSVAGGAVTLRRIAGGKFFGRVVADVTVGERSLAAELIDAGLARPYDGGRRRGWCGVRPGHVSND